MNPLAQQTVEYGVQEFERLDNQVQDMKRGIETPSTLEAERVQVGASDGKDVQQNAGYRSGSELLPPTAAATGRANGSLSLLNLPLKGSSVSNSESRHSQSVHSNSSWQSCNPDEVDVTGKLTGSDLSDSYSHSSVISRRSTSSARRKPRFDSHSGGGASQRQSQARAIVDWK